MKSFKGLLKKLNWSFLIMFVMVMASMAVLYFSLNVQSSYTAKVTLSSRQKALSEEVSKELMIVEKKRLNSLEILNEKKSIEIILSRMENAQKALLTGNIQYGTTLENTDEVNAMLQQSSPFLITGRDITLEIIKSEGQVNSEKISNAIQAFDEFEKSMNNVTGKYLSETEMFAGYIVIVFWSLLLCALILAAFSRFYILKKVGNLMDENSNEVGELLTELEESKQTKNEFLANMSHEIRTPLNGVLGMTEILSKTKLDEDQRGYVRNIHSSATTLIDMVNDILDFSKLKSGKMEIQKERFSLTECVEKVIDLMKPIAQAKKLELMSDFDPSIPEDLLQDERGFRQVLLNLVNNAIKFTDNGEVLVKAELINHEGEFVQIKFTVKDTGIGIDTTRASGLFQSFYQVDSSITKKYGGSGLGLAISKNLVQELGGRIWVESTPGQGSSFFFTIVGETSGSSQQSKINALNGVRALIVDDNKTNLKILVKQLSAWGVQATPFNSPELVTEIMSSLHKFDFVLMDMQMPEMDGRALAEKIRERYSTSQLPIIVLSSVGEHLLQDKEGFYNAYLTKPVKQNKLLDTIIDVIGISPLEKAKEQISKGNFELAHQKSNIKILVAQDNELSRAVTIKTLQLLGHNYDSVTSGREVLDKSKRDDYDLIIMDVISEEMNGIETTKLLKKRIGKDEMPVIIGVTENESRDKQDCMLAGMDDLVEKPMRPEVLQQKIHYWLESE